MKVRLIVVVVIIAALAGGGLYLARPIEISPPSVTPDPEGISQTTVSDVRIERPDWLSEDRSLLWVSARVGEQRKRNATLLIELSDGDTLYSIGNARPVEWLDDTRTLLYQTGIKQKVWEAKTRSYGMEIPKVIFTRFFTFDVDTGVVEQIAELELDRYPSTLDASPDGSRMIGNWGNDQLYEIDFARGGKSASVEEEYIWSPCWLDQDRYVFVGETSILARVFGNSGSKRLSQPLLAEIRDAKQQKGSPSLRMCGIQGGKLLMVDQLPTRSYDRLLEVSEETSLVRELTRLHPSRELPRFNEEGTAIAYQGQQFDRTMANVYYQLAENESQPYLLVEGNEGDVYESNPVFLDLETILYVHWGKELRSIDIPTGETKLHWPISLTP